MAKMSMVDQRLLQMQLDSMQTARALLEKAFMVESRPLSVADDWTIVSGG